ncbi:Telomere-associated protein RIF1 [Quillaja saponaria]|nr:Telomere-associated protein RIF1 [Quillaja saponaria]
MRDSLHIWAPPIYRRLLSREKRERDVSERCLLKIRSTVIPPSINLSKVLVKDMKLNLLVRMKDLLDQGMKVEAIRAWGWFVSMLGSHALKNRHLVNDMLKIPERTFTDLDPQVQIATQVAWEGLIDALIHFPMIASQENASPKDNCVQKQKTSTGHGCDVQANGFEKCLKLIMTPLVGIMSSKCDVSVHSSCLSTWCYLLHKLGTFVNELSVVKLVLKPILEAVFQSGPDSKSMWQWNMCLDMLSDMISEKYRDVDYNSASEVSQNLTARISVLGLPISGKYSWKQYPVSWLPWDLCLLEFHLNIIFILITQASTETVTHGNRSSVYVAAMRLFRSVLKGVQLDLKNPSSNYDDIMLCLKTLLRFMKKICEEVDLDSNDSYDLLHNSILFIQAVTRDLEPSVLGSPLYKFALDLKYMENMPSVSDNTHQKILSVFSNAHMDMVSPIAYLIILYFYVIVQLILNTRQTKSIVQEMHIYFKFIFASYDPLESLLTTISLLYRYVQPIYLNIWMGMVQGLEDYMHDSKCNFLLKTESDSTTGLTINHLLSYPLMVVVHSCPTKLALSKTNGSLEECLTSAEKNLLLGHVIDMWKSLYGSLSASQFKCSAPTDFPEDLCSMLSGYLDEYTGRVGSGPDINLTCKDLDLDLVALSGDIMMCILEQIQTSDLVSRKDRSKDTCDYYTSSGISSGLRFSACCINLLWTKMLTNQPNDFVGTSRVFSALACFVSCLHLKQDVLSVIEIIFSPLLQWLTHMETQDKTTNDQLQLLWVEILGCLRRSHPPVVFDSTFLKLHESLLEKTLDHSFLSISEPTIIFWNSTFGEQIKLDYPQNLLPILDRLSRNGKLKLHKRPVLERCHSHADVNNPQHRCRVTAKHNSSSKRVEFVVDTANHREQKEAPLKSKRKRVELTEHQKEVRRAQQGRDRDSGGHGAGIRTYTNVDFSQGNEDSQESQEIRDSESILQILRRAR